MELLLRYQICHGRGEATLMFPLFMPKCIDLVWWRRKVVDAYLV